MPPVLVAALLLPSTASALAVAAKHVELACGQRLEWLSCAPARPKKHVLCIHGTFHGAWCYGEHWLPRLAEKYEVAAHAVSLRGTSGSPCEAKSVGAAWDGLDARRGSLRRGTQRR